MTAATLERLASVLREDGGLLAAALLPGGPQVGADDPHLGELAATGPRAADDPASLSLAVEAAYEGHLLHRGRSRVLDCTDRDLALLAGDRLYALSLDTLARVGAVAAVGELAGVISLCAQAHAQGDAHLEEAVWAAGATAIGWGASPEVEAARGAARAGEPGAGSALAQAAAALRGGAAQAR